MEELKYEFNSTVSDIAVGLPVTNEDKQPVDRGGSFVGIKQKLLRL